MTRPRPAAAEVATARWVAGQDSVLPREIDALTAERAPPTYATDVDDVLCSVCHENVDASDEPHTWQACAAGSAKRAAFLLDASIDADRARDTATAHLRAVLAARGSCGAWDPGAETFCTEPVTWHYADDHAPEPSCDRHAETASGQTEMPDACEVRAAAAWLAGRPRAGEETERGVPGPPWIVYLESGAPAAILPAGRPGEVADVRGMKRGVVDHVVRLANAGNVAGALAVLVAERAGRGASEKGAGGG